MLRKIGHIILTSVWISIPVLVLSQEEGGDSQAGKTESIKVEEVNETHRTLAETTDKEEGLSAGEKVNMQLRRYAEDLGISYGKSVDGRIFFKAQEVVSVPPDSPNWGKSRTLAFERAFLRTRAQFVRDNFGEQAVELTQRLFEDQSTDTMAFDETSTIDNKLQAIRAKSEALTEAKLDELLEELDVDPSQYDVKGKSEKRKLYEDTIKKTALAKAMGEMSGIIPVKTFEGYDSNGTTVIGVIAMYSPRLKQLAYDLLHQRLPLIEKPPREPLERYIPSRPEDLVNEFGIRVVFDQNGLPNIISYGQWSHNFTGSNPRIRERRNQSARRQARALADSYITLFQNGQLQFTSEQVTGEAVEEILEKDPGGFTSREDTVGFIDRFQETVEARGRTDLSGRGTFDSWSYTHENGQEISGVVRVWTPENLQRTKNVRNWEPKTERSLQEESSEDAKDDHDAGMEESRDVIDVHDF